GDHMLNRRRSIIAACLAPLAGAVLTFAGACSHAPPPPPPAPRQLTDSESAALGWVNAHELPSSATDSLAASGEAQALYTLTNGARIIGLSEMIEGTNEFPLVVRRALFALADSGVRGLAIQAPMPEAMDIDRYVRTGVGDVRRMLRVLGADRWENPGMIALIASIRAWNQAHGSDRQLGFSGFEIPSGAHAVDVVLALPDSVTGAPLKTWLRGHYACVATDEAAHWGLEGRAADSTYWNRCRTSVSIAADSVAALHGRVNAASSAAPAVAYADEMARLIRHYVTTGLRHLPREEGNAAHVMYLADALGPTARLLVWGGDVEMGRLTLGGRTIQTGVALGKQLGAGYRAIAFAVGGGTLRTRRPGRGGEPGGVEKIRIQVPDADSYEEVFSRASRPAYWLDLRALPSDSAGAWLRGPRMMRLISGLYTPDAPQLFDTPIAFPENYDGVIFIRTVTASP
ncbi:MAG: erythromycin esterase family protein, partial [Gemmatimonadaceae bacterium]